MRQSVVGLSETAAFGWPASGPECQSATDDGSALGKLKGRYLESPCWLPTGTYLSGECRTSEKPEPRLTPREFRCECEGTSKCPHTADSRRLLSDAECR